MGSEHPFPLMPPKSTELRLMHFDDYAYTGTSDTTLYKYVDALCGTTGAGALVNEIFLARMAGALETIYFNDLDYIFGKISFLSRSPSESYPYNPQSDMLTADQWDEVHTKDSWYRARIRLFFQACNLGGTPDGIRMCVEAALACDADVYEIWRYLDNFGITSDLGRSPHTARNEVVVRPHKSVLQAEEMRLLRDMLAKIVAVDTVVTVNTQGLATLAPIPVVAAAATSTYYEIQRVVTATPALSQLPAPELLPIDLLPTEQWLFLAKSDPQLAPYTAFNYSAEQGFYYLTGGGRRSPIDSVTYGTLQADGSVKTEPNFQVFSSTAQFTAKQAYEKVDSPDNYPGGKFGITPAAEPALNPDGTPYNFRYASQSSYINAKIAEVEAVGGVADQDGYKLPIRRPVDAARTFYPEYAISAFPPSRDSTVSSSLTARRDSSTVGRPEIRDPANFTRT